ncbi:MAG: hypothetical protein HOL54_10575 [Rhodospirillales bacterium]|nr:hypothetical protein [Rhodospirillales bacterium]MBT5520280.1 hypothetical protein [Rhodospirillales bacterium]
MPRYFVIVGVAIVATAIVGASFFYVTSGSQDQPLIDTQAASIELNGEVTSEAGEEPNSGQTSSIDDQNAPVRPNPEASAFSEYVWVVVALVLMSMATILSSAISFYLYRWRKILLSQPNIALPEQMGDWVEGVKIRLEQLTTTSTAGIGKLVQQGNELQENASNMTETFMTLQHALDERDAEIRRLKRGYDAEIFRKFVSRFIRVGQIVDDLERVGSASAEDLNHVARLLEDAFLECNVEPFQPEIGSDYRETSGVAENPKRTETSNPEEEFKIVEVVENGYQLKTSEGCDIIIPAKVRINVPST